MCPRKNKLNTTIDVRQISTHRLSTEGIQRRKGSPGHGFKQQSAHSGISQQLGRRRTQFAAREEFEYLVQQGICRPSKSTSPLHMVRKTNGSWRPCEEYRNLHAATTPDKYPIAFINDCTRIFSVIDLLRAYRQIVVRTEDVHKTAIVTPFGLFEFVYIDFDLRNAGQTFQRFMHEVLKGLMFFSFAIWMIF